MTYGYDCASCKSKFCVKGISDDSLLPQFCPLRENRNLAREVKKKYEDENVRSFYLNSAEVEIEAYDENAAKRENKRIPIRSRIREIAEFAKKIQAKKIGIAFCVALSDEAYRACRILKRHGLEVISVICTCGAVERAELNVPLELGKESDEFQAACNPLLQAELLNQVETGFNVIVGLCLGHDMLFTKHSRAPVTTLIVKDRVSGHNPVISLYTKFHRDVT